MQSKIKLLPYLCLNFVYKKSFSIYKPLYFKYKELSDAEKIKILNTKIKSGMVVADIGANIGFYSVLLSKLVGPSGCIHSFEPDRQNFHHLRQVTTGLKNIKLNNIAVGEKSKKIQLYLSDELNVNHKTYNTHENRKSKQIQCISIDEYFKASKKPDFVKIDIQGYDYQALLGMRRTIKKTNRLMIFGEFSPFDLSQAGTRPEDYLSLLEKMNFEVTFFDNLEKKEVLKNIDNKIFYCDFFAVKKT